MKVVRELSLERGGEGISGGVAVLIEVFLSTGTELFWAAAGVLVFGLKKSCARFFILSLTWTPVAISGSSNTGSRLTGFTGLSLVAESWFTLNVFFFCTFVFESWSLGCLPGLCFVSMKKSDSSQAFCSFSPRLEKSSSSSSSANIMSSSGSISISIAGLTGATLEWRLGLGDFSIWGVVESDDYK